MKKTRRALPRLPAVALLLIAGGAWGGGAPDAAVLRARVREWRAAHEKQIVGELAALAALRNVASDRQDIERNAAFLSALLAKRGLAPRLLTTGDSPPAVYAELRVPGARRTVVFYAHYDGQPAEAADWQSDPWKPVLRSGALAPGGARTGGASGPSGPAGAPAAAAASPSSASPRAMEVDLAGAPSPLPPEWRLYARAASDDKGPIVGMLAALDALAAAGVSPSVNLKFFFEGEEEAGSPHLQAILDRHHDLLAADAWLLADGPMHPSRRMQLCFGARGATSVEVTVYGPNHPLHSGHYGNWAPNPAALLVQLLAGLRGPEGEIRIAGFYDDVRPLSDSERRAVAEMPAVEAALEDDLGLAWSEGKGGRLQELLMGPALNIRGLRSGQVGAQARNAIPSDATASIDIRLVPDETPQGVRALFEAHLKKNGYWIVDREPDMETRRRHPRIVRLSWEDGYPGARTSMDVPASRAVVRAVEEGLGGPVIKVPMLGGSIPIYLFAESLKVPVIIVPTVNHDNNQHAADENLRLQNLWDGVELFANLFVRLGPDWPS